MLRVASVGIENVQKRQGFGRFVWGEIKEAEANTGAKIYANTKIWWNASLSLAFLKFHFGELTDRPM